MSLDGSQFAILSCELWVTSGGSKVLAVAREPPPNEKDFKKLACREMKKVL